MLYPFAAVGVARGDTRFVRVEVVLAQGVGALKLLQTADASDPAQAR